ncbi:hypothetical protein BV898_02301 [Hypsibius exemplaris]|uniref:DSL domain-containing protein n=1 Tax=Hypsibius exemplaris TaxID=2072580 RepID=A0A1W0X989_HYPEX|nr:hypothetical protein BV898_02301 [Hypsibius exemplaris]
MALALLLFWTSVLLVKSSLASFHVADTAEVVGNLTIRFVSFSNPRHVIATGEGCDLGWFGSKECDPRFTFCFVTAETLWNSNDTQAVTHCDFAGPFHCGPYDNAGEIGFSNMICNYPNPMILNITKAWTGAEMRVRVDEMERGSFLGSNTAVGSLIDNFSYFFNARPALDNVMKLSIRGFTKANTTLVLEAQIRCLPNYYDLKCSTFCLPTQRYDCDRATGQMVCKTGWSGDTCSARTVSDNLTIHPLSFGTQVDEMIVYDMQAPDEPDSNSTTGDREILTTTAAWTNTTTPVSVTPDEVILSVIHDIHEDVHPHFDAQSASAANKTAETSHLTNGVATVRPSTMSSIWPLTVSLVVGGIGVFASSSTTSSPPEVTKTSVSQSTTEFVTTVSESSTPVTVSPVPHTTEKANGTTPSVLESTSQASTVAKVQTSATEQPLTNTTMSASPSTVAAEGTVNTTVSAVTPTTEAVLNGTNKSPTVVASPLPVGMINMPVLVTTIPTTSSMGRSNLTHIGKNGPANGTSRTLPGTPPSTTVQPTESGQKSIGVDRLSLAKAVPAVIKTESALSKASSIVSTEKTTQRPTTFAGSTADAGMNTTDSPRSGANANTTVTALSVSTTAGFIVSVTVKKGDWNLSVSGSLLPVTTQTPLNVSENFVAITEAPMKVFVGENYTIKADEDEILLDKTTPPTSLVSMTVNLANGSVKANKNSQFTSAVPEIENTTVQSDLVAPQNGVNASKEDVKIPFRTFLLHSGLRFQEPLSNMAFLDQMNASVYELTEAILNNRTFGNLIPGLKTAVEFTGITINSSAVVPQITLYASLNGRPVLTDFEFGVVLEEAIINLRQNATMTGVPHSVSHLGYANNHPVMIFLIAMLTVAIVVLIGIIMVLSRKPTAARRCQVVGPFCDQEQHDLSASFDSFSSASAYDNVAFAEQHGRLHFVSDDEIVSLEPSSHNARTAQERLFARRSAAHSIQSPAAVHINRTTTTFSKPAGSTI